MSLSYPVVLIQSEEGYAVGCPALPGCWSQGATEKEALQNICEAIQDYLAAVSSVIKIR
jgi:predicted RNase H-like HicB family nuclease